MIMILTSTVYQFLKFQIKFQYFDLNYISRDIQKLHKYTCNCFDVFSITATLKIKNNPAKTTSVPETKKQYHICQHSPQITQIQNIGTKYQENQEKQTYEVELKKLRYKLTVYLTFSIIFKKKNKKLFMTESIKIQSFDSEIIYNSEESIEQRIPSNSFLNDVLEKQLEQDSQTRIKRDQKKTKPILKREKPEDAKKRNNSKSGKWSGANRLNYYRAILKFSIEHPYFKISWKFWKPEKFYPRMIQQINKNEIYYKKDVIQTKSFDQRQRKQYFQKEPHLDMIDLAKHKLRQVQANDVQAKQILADYEAKSKEKSLHMQLLDQAMLKLNQKKYDIEDLHCKIMGYNKLMIPECTSSVFYS